MTDPLIMDAPEADACVIWLHGLGADRFDFQPVAQALQQVLPTTRFILPQAPTRPVTVNNGWMMPSWYDILAFSPARAIDEQQLNESADHVIDLIRSQQQDGIDDRRIVLAGFSQGGAVVYHTVYVRGCTARGGLMALSTYAPTFDSALTIPPERQSLPVLCLHGNQDPVVDCQLGRAAYTFLRERGVDAQWHDYAMGHEVIPEQLHNIAKWLHDKLSNV